MKHELQRTLATFLALALLTIPIAATSFPDVPDNAVYADAAEYLNEAGIMQGDAQGNFNPDKSVTRAQMAAILCRMLDETEDLATDGSQFTDVPASYWANGYILKAADLGIIGGYKDGTFKPDNTVTFEQAVTMVVRAVGGETIAQESGGYPSGFLSIAKTYGFLSGVKVASGTEMSRANVAIVLYNSNGFYFDT